MRETVSELLEQIGRVRRAFLLLDYDGTLVPIAPTPELARPTPELLHILRRLVSHDRWQVAIVSGRSLRELEGLVPVDGLFYIGAHGAEIRTPTGERHRLAADDSREPLEELAQTLEAVLADCPGCLLERKGFSLALHYRQARDEVVQTALAHFLRLGEPLVRSGAFEWLKGKKIFELRPAGVNKGHAVQELLKRYARPEEQPVYVGDDETDEDAFRILRDSGITVLVSPEARPTRAQYRVDSPQEVHRLLELLADIYGA
jgi:trehalose 6-phosphate phosphatase